ncbi:MAG: hypothetical protein GIW95_09725, partial [Candidatus Eremiobacteraeota bacterium]|nr:hypothetical protein [Candidatus Eremiobacteraeota bacterium]
VYETSDDGKDVQDRTYRYKWKRPSMAQIDVLAGPGKGGGAVWTGGEQVRGHQGGILSGIKMSIDIHDKRAVSLRGNTIAAASFEYMIKHFLTTTGALAESPGPTIDGIATTTITLAVADPKSDGNVTREVLYLGTAKHLPVRRDAFVGTQLVGSETFKDVQTNTGIKTEDFNA